MDFSNSNVLITAGPTWVAIDRVRVLSNFASGETGILLARELKKRGAKVTLVLGNAAAEKINKGIRLLRFVYFDELYKALKKELKVRRYDWIIHSAAVSDFKPKVVYTRKLSSAKKALRLTLIPTPKIIDAIREAAYGARIVGFKFEPYAPKALLLKQGRALLRRAALTAVVANTITRARYEAYILSKDSTVGPFSSKRQMVQGLLKVVEK